MSLNEILSLLKDYNNQTTTVRGFEVGNIYLTFSCFGDGSLKADLIPKGGHPDVQIVKLVFDSDSYEAETFFKSEEELVQILKGEKQVEWILGDEYLPDSIIGETNDSR